MFIYILLVFFFFLFLSYLFAGSESAIFSIHPAQLNRMRANYPTKELGKLQWISDCLKHPEKTLILILLSNLTVNITLTHLGNLLFNAIFGIQEYLIYQLISITLILLLFAEIIPKMIGIQFADRWLLWWTPFLQKCFTIVGVVAQPIYKFFDYWITKIPVYNIQKIDEARLLESVQIAQSYSSLSQKDKYLLENFVLFYYDTIFSVMIPASSVFMASKHSTMSSIIKEISAKQYRYVMIYENNMNTILGYISIIDIMLSQHKQKKTLSALVTPTIYLPETMPLNIALENLIQSKKEIAIVLQEGGDFSGIVTLKQLVHSLMGERPYSVAQDSQLIHKNNNDTYRLDGLLTLDEFNEYFRHHLISEHAETISGFILEQLDGFPDNNTKLYIHPFNFSNIKVKKNRIASLVLAKRTQ